VNIKYCSAIAKKERKKERKEKKLLGFTGQLKRGAGPVSRAGLICQHDCSALRRASPAVAKFRSCRVKP